MKILQILRILHISQNLSFRFAPFGLLRRIYDSPRNDRLFYNLIRVTNHNRSNGGSALDYFCVKQAR
ncbi:hypothetical protein ACWIUD_09575 [Helicobacter sp. 23-1044]